MQVSFKGQACQDLFVLKCLKNKRNGYFLEIGSNHPININNTYILEKEFNWKGIMVEYSPEFLDLYKHHRPSSEHIIQDATTIDYLEYFKKLNFPANIDYLQIDLEVDNRSTLTTLENINSQLMDSYKFAVVTFEHDIYTGDFFDTRNKSRQIFESRGYVRVFSDVDADVNGKYSPYEDWYVHPELVDMNLINKIKNNVPGNDVSKKWYEIQQILNIDYEVESQWQLSQGNSIAILSFDDSINIDLLKLFPQSNRLKIINNIKGEELIQVINNIQDRYDSLLIVKGDEKLNGKSCTIKYYKGMDSVYGDLEQTSNNTLHIIQKMVQRDDYLAVNSLGYAKNKINKIEQNYYLRDGGVWVKTTDKSKLNISINCISLLYNISESKGLNLLQDLNFYNIL